MKGRITPICLSINAQHSQYDTTNTKLRVTIDASFTKLTKHKLNDGNFFFLGTNMTIQASTRIIKPKHATEHILLYYKQGAFIPGQLAIGQ